MMNTRTQLRTLALATMVALMATANVVSAADKSATEQIDDTAITAKVKAALIGDKQTKAHNIDVEVYKGRVQLNGFVDSDAERKQAVIDARNVKGVIAVDNNLVIKGADRSAGVAVDDATIAVKVKAALAADSRTKAHQINVESSNAVVQLAGFVNSKADMMAANDVARSVAGVARVDNKLAVK